MSSISSISGLVTAAQYKVENLGEMVYYLLW